MARPIPRVPPVTTATLGIRASPVLACCFVRRRRAQFARRLCYARPLSLRFARRRRAQFARRLCYARPLSLRFARRRRAQFARRLCYARRACLPLPPHPETCP